MDSSLGVSSGVAYSVIEAMIRLGSFESRELAAFTGSDRAAVERILSILEVAGVIRPEQDRASYSCPPERVEEVRSAADAMSNVCCPGVAYRIAEVLLREQEITPEMAAGLAPTTVGRATWELGQLLARGWAACHEVEGRLVVTIPEDSERLSELAEWVHWRALPLHSETFPFVTSLWYWAAVGIAAARNPSRRDLQAAIRYLSKARQEAPSEGEASDRWHAFVDMTDAQVHLAMREFELAQASAARASRAFAKSRLRRYQNKAVSLTSHIAAQSDERASVEPLHPAPDVTPAGKMSVMLCALLKDPV